MNTNGGCTVCPTGCVICPNVNFCSSAGNGFYLIPNIDGSNSGQFEACLSPCATCSGDKKSCTSCVTGFTLNGTQCQNNNRIRLGITLIGGIFSGGTAASNLATGMSSVNRVRFALCKALPAA